MINTETATPEGLIACLEELESTGHTLREALITHNAEAIWNAVAEQDKATQKLDRLQKASIWLMAHSGKVAVIKPELKDRMAYIMKRLQSLQRVNRAMSRVFLELIDKTLTAFSVQNQPAPLTYTARGYMDRANGSLFVQQMG